MSCTQPDSSRRTAATILLSFLALIVLMGSFGATIAEARKKKKLRSPPPDLPSQVNYWAKQLYGVPLDDSEPLTSKIQKLVLDHLQEWIAPRTPSDVEVRRELEKVFAQLHWPLFGTPMVFAQPWKGGMAIGAGYTLGWTDYDRVNVIALFNSREGQSHMAAVANFVPRTDLHYEVLPSEGPGDLRFFAYGFRLGKSQLRLSAVLYAFDGQNLKSQWQTQDVYDGKLDVQGDRVTIRYLKEDEYIREQAHGRKPPRYEAIYKLAPQGLEIVTDHEIPF